MAHYGRHCVSQLSGGVGSYDLGSGAIIEASTGYKLIVGSQNAAQDTLSWDSRDYPCNRTHPGPDCTPHCLFNVLDDPQVRLRLQPPEMSLALAVAYHPACVCCCTSSDLI
jgi:hypothetical protein